VLPDLPRGPTYSLAGRCVAGAQAGGGKVPGPGAYEAVVPKSDTPARTMGGKVQDSSVAGEQLVEVDLSHIVSGCPRDGCCCLQGARGSHCVLWPHGFMVGMPHASDATLLGVLKTSCV
jgi:hypothetical protein